MSVIILVGQKWCRTCGQCWCGGQRRPRPVAELRLCLARARLHPTSVGGETEVVGAQTAGKVVSHHTTGGRYPLVS